MFFMGVIKTLQIMLGTIGLIIETQNFMPIAHLMYMQVSTEVIALSCCGMVLWIRGCSKEFLPKNNNELVETHHA